MPPLKPSFLQMGRLVWLLLVISYCHAIAGQNSASQQENFYPLSRKGVSSESTPGLYFLPNFTRNGQPPLTLKNLYSRLYSVRLESTTESVTDRIALKINFDAGTKFTVVYVDVDSTTFPHGYAGLTFYAKASRPMAIKVKTANGISPDFNVGKSWRKFNLPAAPLFVDVPAGSLFEIFAVDKQPADGYLIIDRLGIEKELDSRPPVQFHLQKDSTIHSSEILLGSNYLSSLRKRLNKKQPICIYGWGDSITHGVQMNRGNNKHPKTGLAYIPPIDDRYYGRLAAKLREHYGYENIVPVEKAGGGCIHVKRAQELKGQILAQAKPGDVVIVQFGGNDFSNGKRISTFIGQVEKAIDELRTVGAEMILITPPLCDCGEPGANAALELSLTEAMTKLSEKKAVPVVNLLKLMTYRGDRYGWAWESNRCHLDFWGHELIAQLFMALITEQSFIWSPHNDNPGL